MTARDFRPDVALSHGSYAQICAARLLRTPTATMMEYEHQPANHLSFRLAHRVLVPEVFPESKLRSFGARPQKVRRYEGFKEELYLGDFVPSTDTLHGLALNPSNIIVVFRPPPTGSLYHRGRNDRFDRIVSDCAKQGNVQAVLLARTAEQRPHYEEIPHLTVPKTAVDGLSLVANADLVVGAGGTMNREAALLGVPTYTVFLGRLGAVDAQLLKLGCIRTCGGANCRP